VQPICMLMSLCDSDMKNYLNECDEDESVKASNKSQIL